MTRSKGGGMSCWVLAAVLAPALWPQVQGGEPVREIPPAGLFPDAAFDRNIPTQREVIGVEHGSRPLRHPEVVRYLEALQAASPRARVLPYARSHEDRPLFVLAVGDEQTIANLDHFRAEHARLMDPRNRRAEEDAGVLAGAHAVAWMAYGIHGDELSSVDAAAALAYWLVAGEDERARAMRRELLVLIDPCENPDGRERFLSQTTAFAHAVPNPDTEDLSHTTVWPWGRGNHYLFDLNRDWFSMVQPESRRTSVIASWQPQLMVDSHEMGAHDTYLFPPARHPFNPHMGEHVRRWWQRFAADQASALDGRGYGYYTREWNEEFFPGYGSSWANYHGSIGILYEMSSTEGTLVRKRGGVVRTYAEAVEHQVTSSLANLTTLLQNRREILQDYVTSRRDAVRQGREGPLSAWILVRGRYPARTDALARLLRSQGIEVLRLAGEAVSADNLRDARTGQTARLELREGSYLIPLDQPAGNLARVLLDPHVPMEAEFFREEREYLERGKGTRLYDTTAWSLILSYGVEAWWSRRKPAGNWQILIPREAGEQGQGMVTLPAADRGAVFAYAFDGVSDASVAALADLLQRKIRVKIAEKTFRVGEHEFHPGAVVVQREGNPDDLAGRLAEIAERWSVPITPLPTARAAEGPDLGGSHFHDLITPRVGIWTGMPVSPSAYGALWHLLDHELRVRFSGLDLAGFSSTDLRRYNVLIFPPSFGGAGGYRHLLGESGLKRLKSWIEAGGTAIGIGSGAEFLANRDVGLTKTRLRRQALERYPPVVVGIGAMEAERAGRFRAVGIRAPEPEKKDEPSDDRKKAAERAPERSGPYDVAPLLGPGARPFAGELDQGTAVEPKPRDLADWLAPLLPPGQAKPEDKDLERADRRLRLFRPQGAFVRLELDPELWMAWGLPSSLDALVRASDTLVAEPPVHVPARFAGLEDLHLGGLLWPEAAGRIARTAYTTRESLGRGQVILFLNEPDFRNWTLGTRRLLLNAVLYGPGLGTRWSTPW